MKPMKMRAFVAKEGDNEMILNIGSGHRKVEGAINIDIEKGSRPDVLGDAQQMPFKDNSFSKVIASHVMEHLDMKLAMKEIHRILKTGGKVEITCPFAGHPLSYQFDHKCQLKARDFYCFEKGNEYNHHVDWVNFVIEDVKYEHGYPRRLIFLWAIGKILEPLLNRKGRTFREHYECYLSFFFPVMTFRIIMKKDHCELT